LAQPHPFPEVLINASPEVWFHYHTSRSPRPNDLFHPEALADYLAAARRPANISGMCEDYRAAAGIDLVDDRESRAAGHKVRCPMLALWGERGNLGRWYDVLAIWRAYCTETVTGGSVGSGHYLPEEAPDAVIDWFDRFFG
jgi:haloacetate dehalogenase